MFVRSTASASNFEEEFPQEERCENPLGQDDAGAMPPAVLDDLLQQLGFVALSDVTFDAACGILSGLPVGEGAAQSRTRIRIHADDCGLLESMACMDTVRLELRPAEGRYGSLQIVLQECRGGGAWKYGAIAWRQAPAFVVAELASRSRLAELGRQLCVLGHELRQPLTTISMANENLRVMLGDDVSPSVAHAVDAVEEQVGRAQAIIRQVMDYAAGNRATDAGQPEDAEFAAGMQNAARLLRAQLDAANVELTLEYPDLVVPVGLSQIELDQILVNIVRNAIESISDRHQLGWSEQGKIAMRLNVDDTRIVCEIVDNGLGLQSGASEDGFQPFSTTKGAAGTGLGLYLCENLLFKAGGRLRLLPGEGEGARVEIVLPRERP